MNDARRVSRNAAFRLALTVVAFATVTTACGGTTSASTSPAATASAAGSTPLPSPVVTAASPSCPTAIRVGSALGITLPKPVGIAGGGGTALPPGATGLACEYHAPSYNVIIELITNIDPSNISKFSSRFPVAFTSVPGVGDQARAFSVSLGGGKDNEGVVATKGSTLVAITATATPASLTQIEALVTQLLG